MTAVLQLTFDQVSGVRFDSELEPKVKQTGELQIDQHIGILNGDLHRRRQDDYEASEAKRWSNSRKLTFRNSAAFARVISSCAAAR